jgi:molybdopterin synthase sulfur carrier subunit
MPVVKLYANLRNLAGTKEISIPGLTVRTVLDELVQRYPQLGPILLQDEGLRPHIVVTLNGHNAVDLSLTTAEQDIVAIFPPIAGG